MKIGTKDGVHLYAKDWGEGNPVILIHGWPLSADTWDDVAIGLANAGHRVIFYDRRGFGRSDQPFTGYDYDTLADDLSAVVDATGSEQVSLVGFSMGGGEIARYMSRHRGRAVVKAALIASVVPYMAKTSDNPNGVPSDTFEQMTLSLKEDRAAFFAKFFDDFYGQTLLTKPVSKEVIEWSRQVAMQASLKATLDCARAFATTDFRPDLLAFKVPTLVIHGTADKTVPIAATGRAAAELISQATVIEYADAPHGLFATHKRRLVEDLVTFLR